LKVLEARERRRRAAPSVDDIAPALARDFLAHLAVGDRMPTVRELARQHRSSNSSVHAAIGRLEAAGAIAVDTRGRAGAFLLERAVGRLWAMAGSGPLVISLPLANSPRYEGLATAMKQLLAVAGLDAILSFVRGSRQRLQALREGRCHLATMSSFAASELCGPDDTVIMELLPNSYNTGHRVFYGPNRESRRPLRVVVDQHSADQQLLTALEFAGSPVVMLPAMTAQIARMLVADQADAAVWTADEMESRRRAGIADRPLSEAVRDRIGDRDTRAALVGRVSDAPVLREVCSALDPAELERIQNDVVEGRVVPEY
jgi:hypothetical protein